MGVPRSLAPHDVSPPEAAKTPGSGAGLRVLRSARALAASRRGRAALLRLVCHALLLVGALAMLLPFFWMISTSLKDTAYVLVFPPQWIPNPIKWENYPNT